MKAAILYGPRNVKIEDIDIPKITRHGEVIIDIKACGICPSDLRVFLGFRKQSYPTTFGHEWVGDVVEAKDTDRFNVGDRVAVAWPEYCYECHYCEKGRLNLCQKRWAHESVFGGFMEYGRAHFRNLRKIDKDISYEEAAFAEPLACAINGISKADVSLGDSVVIIGDGPLGIINMQLAKLRGALKVIVSGHHAERLHLAKQLGADHVINAKEMDPVKEVKDITEGKGVDSVLIVASNKSAVEQSLQMVDRGGSIVIFAGIYPQTYISIDPNFIHYNEIRLIGSIDFTPHMFTEAVEIINTKKISLRPLISHTFPLDQISEGFEVLEKRESFKVMIKI